MRIILARALIALLAPSHAYYASRPNNLGASSYASEFHAVRPVPSVDSTLQSTFDRMAPAGHPLSDPLAVFVGDLEASACQLARAETDVGEVGHRSRRSAARAADAAIVVAAAWSTLTPRASPCGRLWRRQHSPRARCGRRARGRCATSGSSGQRCAVESHRPPPSRRAIGRERDGDRQQAAHSARPSAAARPASIRGRPGPHCPCTACAGLRGESGSATGSRRCPIGAISNGRGPSRASPPALFVCCAAREPRAGLPRGDAAAGRVERQLCGTRGDGGRPRRERASKR